MQDMIGGKIREGDLVMWNGILATVKLASDSTTAHPEVKSMLVIEIKIANPEPARMGIVRVIDPGADKLQANGMAGGN